MRLAPEAITFFYEFSADTGYLLSQLLVYSLAVCQIGEYHT